MRRDKDGVHSVADSIFSQADPGAAPVLGTIETVGFGAGEQSAILGVSLRQGQADLAGSYARIEDQQCWLLGAKIAAYENAASANHEPTRKRRLLLHRAEIRKIGIKLEQRGFTLVPLRICFNEKGLAKIEIALARGKRQYDKRQTIAERTQKRDVDRDMKR